MAWLLPLAALFEAIKFRFCRMDSVAGETVTFETGLVDKQLASLGMHALLSDRGVTI